MKYFNGRTKTLLSLIAFFAIFMFSSSAPWNKFWMIAVAIALLLFTVDVMFISSKNFELDPFYSNWEARMNANKHD